MQKFQSMKEIKFKFFLQSDVNSTIKKVESLLLKREADSNIFIKIYKLHYININSLKKSILSSRTSGRRFSIMKFYPLNVKRIFNLLYQFVFHKIRLCSFADIINIRNNLSLFYFREGIRVKAYMKTGIRNLEAFKNEYFIRKKVEEIGLLHVPKLLGENLDSEPFFFIDEIVFGKMVNWNDPKGYLILKDALKDMWKFYQFNGINWHSLREKGIDIFKLVDNFRSLIENNSKFNNNLDLDKLSSFPEKYIPSSLIHGDFSLGNIITTSSGNYLIDWELSRYDFIIKDFYKTLIRKWELFDDLNALMCSEIYQHFGDDKDSALSLYEQFILEHFLRLYNSKTNSSLLPHFITEYLEKQPTSHVVG